MKVEKSFKLSVEDEESVERILSFGQEKYRPIGHIVMVRHLDHDDENFEEEDYENDCE